MSANPRFEIPVRIKLAFTIVGDDLNRLMLSVEDRRGLFSELVLQRGQFRRGKQGVVHVHVLISGQGARGLHAHTIARERGCALHGVRGQLTLRGNEGSESMRERLLILHVFRVLQTGGC